jgi:hypothetical protein
MRDTLESRLSRATTSGLGNLVLNPNCQQVGPADDEEEPSQDEHARSLPEAADESAAAQAARFEAAKRLLAEEAAKKKVRKCYPAVLAASDHVFLARYAQGLEVRSSSRTRKGSLILAGTRRRSASETLDSSLGRCTPYIWPP